MVYLVQHALYGCIEPVPMQQVVHAGLYLPQLVGSPHVQHVTLWLKKVLEVARYEGVMQRPQQTNNLYNK